MTFRTHAMAALAVGLVAAEFANAQPVPPARPTYSPYSSIIRGTGGGAYSAFGFPQQDNSALVQNQLLAQQINQTAQQIQGLQTFLATGVNPNLGITGRGATYGYLGHWYPSARGGGGGGMGGGIVSPNRPLVGVGSNALRTAALGAGAASAFGAGGPFGGGTTTTTPKGTATVPK